MERLYFAVAEGDPETGYSIFFPHVPGCVSAGDTLAEALESAEEALSLHLDEMAKDGEPLPEEIGLTPADYAEASPPALVSAIRYRPALQRRRVNVMLDERLLTRIDRVARNRSAFLAQAARHELDRMGEG